MPEQINIDILLAEYPCRLLCGDPADSGPITGGYACDLLSLVVSRIKTNDVWFTILNSINVIAVATLAECAYVMLTDGVEMESRVLDRAREKGVCVLSTTLPTYEASAALADLLRRHKP